jgi:hypothetical protein
MYTRCDWNLSVFEKHPTGAPTEMHSRAHDPHSAFAARLRRNAARIPDPLC